MKRIPRAILCMALAALVLGCGGALPKKLPTREAFEKSHKGKSKDDVLKALGRPKSTIPIGTREAWSYNYATHDPIAAKDDVRTSLWFDAEGKVESFDYRPGD